MTIPIPLGKAISNLFKGKLVKVATGVVVGGTAATVGAPYVFDVGPGVLEAIQGLTGLVTAIAAVIAAIAGLTNHNKAA